ncbi:MAG: alkyl sulfatase dimerization domain-containing protein [Endozoicomonas sp.]|uniref:alkyl sulfatase dimerization domain-containing protein n=1 Tax=Endozoicomonas sp. TaxID=1892382 RepID=UPI003D9B1A0D
MRRYLIPTLLATGLLAGCNDSAETVSTTAAASTEASSSETVHPAMKAVLPEMQEKVYEVTKGVYQAVGFGGANSIMVEGDDGIIIVDAMASVESARRVKAAFREITDKPIKAIVYTHNHGDHVFGGPGFVEGEENPEDIQIWAHDTTQYYINRVVNVLAPAIGARSNRMIGALLEKGDKGFVHYGLATQMETIEPGNHADVIPPTHTFSDKAELNIAGVNLELVHVAGETNDQIIVWLPDQKVIMPGDNVYKSFPNLYTLRGTSYRDIKKWYESVDTMLEFEPEFLAPSHTLPVEGKENVKEILTAYRDGIQFVHDQTIRLINQGLSPDELVEQVKLPEHLANHPYLFEYYGKVEWAVRNIFSGYLGWYDSNVSKLLPISPDDTARQMADLAGGEEALLAKAQEAFEQKNYNWVLQLTDHLMRLQSENKVVKELRAESATQLGYAMHNSNARDIYLTEAAELRGVEMPVEQMEKSTNKLIKAMPVRGFIESLAVNLNPEKSLETDETMVINFTDTDESYTIHVRRGVAIIKDQAITNPDNSMTTTSEVWLEIMAGDRSLPGALATADIELDGGRLSIPSALGFLSMFQG